MTARGRRWFLASLFGAAALCAGCDFGSLAYFVMPETKEPAELKRLASADKKKEVRAVILTYLALETRAEFIQADRELSERLAKHLRELCEANDEKVTIIPTRRVEEFKNAHPDWIKMDLTEIGRVLRADYVIYLEINSLGLYSKGSMNTMFQGQADISVTVADVNNPDDTPEQKRFSCVYPSDARGPVPVGDTHPMEFRQAFLNYLAKRLSYYFAPYPKRETYYVE
jgi:hypothetical protein